MTSNHTTPGDRVFDPDQVDAVFERYYRDVWGFVARMAGADTADDITGDVFTTAFAQRDRYDPARGGMRAWLCGIAVNRLRTRYRSDERARRAFERAAWQRVVAADPFELVDDTVAVRVTGRAVIDAIAHLATGERELLVLYAWEQLSYAEIASALAVPVGTVRSRLSRARGRLRELVALYGEELTTTRTERER